MLGNVTERVIGGSILSTLHKCLGKRVGAVVRALAFHQCVPGSIPGPGVICGLSLLVLYSAPPRGFSFLSARTTHSLFLFVFQGKKLKPEQETDDDGEGYVTDEDEAADISPEAQATLEKTGEGAERAAATAATASAATASATPPAKRKEKKPKKVCSSVEEKLLLFAYHFWS